jgi:hypothetical protein
MWGWCIPIVEAKMHELVSLLSEIRQDVKNDAPVKVEGWQTLPKLVASFPIVCWIHVHNGTHIHGVEQRVTLTRAEQIAKGPSLLARAEEGPSPIPPQREMVGCRRAANPLRRRS